eukprot:3038725-Prorocentrum_lima.AAC.1
MLAGALLDEAASTRDHWFRETAAPAEQSYRLGVGQEQKIGFYYGTGQTPTGFCSINSGTSTFTNRPNPYQM